MKVEKIILFLIIFSFNLISYSYGERTEINISPFTPETITQAIDTHKKARVVLHYIFNDNEKTKIFFDGIEGGEERWLKLYPIFRPATDAMFSLTLDISLAYSIKNNPKYALEMLYEGGGEAKRICSHFEEEWTDGEEFTESLIRIAMQETNLRAKALNSLSSEFLHQNILNDCKEILQKYTEYWGKELVRISSTK